MLRTIYHRQLWSLLEPVRPFLEAPDVGEVLINGPHEIYVERRGRLERQDVRFEDDEALMAALRLISQMSGRSLDRERPILEASLPDGSRLEAVVPPAAPAGPQVAIRRFSRQRLTLEGLVASGSIEAEAATRLRALVAERRNLLVAGGTGSGKTSLLNVLTGLIPVHERVVTLEDARELRPAGEHVVALEAQPGMPDGQGRVTIRELFAATLRLRPDRIVVGEIRDGAALDMLHAMLSGHAGCLSTVHANHTHAALHRVETLALMADVGLPLAALQRQVSDALDAVVRVARTPSGRRVVQGIDGVRGLDAAGHYDVVSIYQREIRDE